jgi:hypothetical protein
MSQGEPVLSNSLVLAQVPATITSSTYKWTVLPQRGSESSLELVLQLIASKAWQLIQTVAGDACDQNHGIFNTHAVK